MLFNALYQISIKLIWIFLHPASLFSSKIWKFLQARRQFTNELPKYNPGGGKLVWMHCASLGEFEQGKPLLEEIKKKYEHTKVLVSFFSPSGFERVLTGGLVDHKVYLPIDNYSSAKKFVDKYSPDLAIFVKYEFWYNFLRILNEQNIPTVFISVVIHKGHFIFKALAKPVLNELSKVHRLFLQDEASYKALEEKGFNNIMKAGDTRIDTVAALPKLEFDDQLIKQFCKTDKAVIVVGSCWKKDITLLGKLDPEHIRKYRWIIAPHEMKEYLFAYIEKCFAPLRTARYSKGDAAGNDVLILDAIGILKYIYRYAKYVYIGGGFGAGIHNTLEPAAYGKPVFFGPKYRKFVEAIELVREQAFFCVQSAEEFGRELEILESGRKYEETVAKINAYIEENRHATKVILGDLESFL